MGEMTEIQKQKVMSSPALAGRSDWYPDHWHNKVPFRVRMLRDVCSDFPQIFGRHVALGGEEYPVWVNMHGAISTVFKDGTKLGVKPDEFVVTEFHPSEGMVFK